MTRGNLSTQAHSKSNGLPGNEQERFAQRLKLALTNSNFPDDSPTRLAREFNARFPSIEVTAHATRTWLAGESIPTHTKLKALAGRLNVSAAWLSYGDSDARMPSKSDVKFDTSALTLITDLQRLDKKQVEIVREFIRILLHASRKQ